MKYLLPLTLLLLTGCTPIKFSIGEPEVAKEDFVAVSKNHNQRLIKIEEFLKKVTQSSTKEKSNEKTN